MQAINACRATDAVARDEGLTSETCLWSDSHRDSGSNLGKNSTDVSVLTNSGEILEVIRQDNVQDAVFTNRKEQQFPLSDKLNLDQLLKNPRKFGIPIDGDLSSDTDVKSSHSNVVVDKSRDLVFNFYQITGFCLNILFSPSNDLIGWCVTGPRQSSKLAICKDGKQYYVSISPEERHEIRAMHDQGHQRMEEGDLKQATKLFRGVENSFFVIQVPINPVKVPNRQAVVYSPQQPLKYSPQQPLNDIRLAGDFYNEPDDHVRGITIDSAVTSTQAPISDHLARVQQGSIMAESIPDIDGSISRDASYPVRVTGYYFSMSKQDTLTKTHLGAEIKRAEMESVGHQHLETAKRQSEHSPEILFGHSREQAELIKSQQRFNFSKAILNIMENKYSGPKKIQRIVNKYNKDTNNEEYKITKTELEFILGIKGKDLLNRVKQYWETSTLAKKIKEETKNEEPTSSGTGIASQESSTHSPNPVLSTGKAIASEEDAKNCIQEWISEGIVGFASQECLITFDQIEEPVMIKGDTARDEGKVAVFEYKAISQWLEQGGRHPYTRSPVSPNDLVKMEKVGDYLFASCERGNKAKEDFIKLKQAGLIAGG
jgi:hypothetical protein